MVHSTGRVSRDSCVIPGGSLASDIVPLLLQAESCSFGTLPWKYCNPRTRAMVSTFRVLRQGALLLLTLLTSSLFFVPPLQAQVTPLGRPILFVHGWCGDGTEWQPLRNYIVAA